MAQQRETATDRLVSIIANIKLERQSGQLRVRRGEGLTSEEGILTFVRGQVTQASVGRRNGADALNWLSTWGQARYIFLSATPVAKISEEFPPPPPSSSPGEEGKEPDGLVARVNTDKLETETGNGAPYACVMLGEAIAKIEQAGLSRTHRRLYLLIDGRRSVYELAPLLGKKVDDVSSMLQDLAWIGVIQVPGARMPGDPGVS